MGMDVLVLPSRNEAFGLVLAEAMRCGIAVMGVNAGGVPEIIDDTQTGLLFEWGNTDQTGRSSRTFIQGACLKNDLARHGKEKADREFNSETPFSAIRKLVCRFELVPGTYKPESLVPHQLSFVIILSLLHGSL